MKSNVNNVPKKKAASIANAPTSIKNRRTFNFIVLWPTKHSLSDLFQEHRVISGRQQIHNVKGDQDKTFTAGI